VGGAEHDGSESDREHRSKGFPCHLERVSTEQYFLQECSKAENQGHFRYRDEPDGWSDWNELPAKGACDRQEAKCSSHEQAARKHAAD
jgi:hypothetical protein